MSEPDLCEITVDPLINKEEVLIQNNQPQELKMGETLGNNSSQNNERSLWLDSIMKEVTEDENIQPLLEKKIPRVPHKLLEKKIPRMKMKNATVLWWSQSGLIKRLERWRL
uniref:Uncharacterized protein n=1 Tax=Salix viminalis TaxID=40686 RepID=A0A6N2LNS5_SALVM